MGNLARATRRQPCPICHKPDWCMVAADMAICMRVVSPRPYVFKNGAEGYIHSLAEPIKDFIPERKEEKPELNVKALMRQWERWHARGGPSHTNLAIKLGVTLDALHALQCTYAPEYRAWAFPMRGGAGEYRGVRLRNEEGRKWAVRGSKEGVFYPFQAPKRFILYVVEGPTDCAAGLSIGLETLGRPSCHGGVDDVRQIVRAQGYQRVVIITDSDDVGRRGALLLAKHVMVPHCLINLPVKDLRQFVNGGGTEKELNYIIEHTHWTKGNK